MDSVTLVGIDLGKHSFHLHGQDRKGQAVFRKKFNRKPLIEFFAKFHPCTAVMEACADAHYLARKLAAMGHEVKLISPQYVRPFVKGNKNDFIDAEAISSPAAATLRPRSGWCRASTAPAARPRCWASASAATRTCDGCSCSAPGSSCCAWTNTPARWPTGCAPCSRDGTPTSSPARWPTSSRAWPGRWRAGTRSTSRASCGQNRQQPERQLPSALQPQPEHPTGFATAVAVMT